MNFIIKIIVFFKYIYLYLCDIFKIDKVYIILDENQINDISLKYYILYIINRFNIIILDKIIYYMYPYLNEYNNILIINNNGRKIYYNKISNIFYDNQLIKIRKPVMSVDIIFKNDKYLDYKQIFKQHNLDDPIDKILLFNKLKISDLKSIVVRYFNRQVELLNIDNFKNKNVRDIFD